MKPDSTVQQILALASSQAHRKLLGDRPATPAELAEASIQALIVLAAVLDVLTIEQRQVILEKIKNL